MLDRQALLLKISRQNDMAIKKAILRFYDKYWERIVKEYFKTKKH